VGLILFGFEWGSTYVENQKQAHYDDVPFELKLKSGPEDVLYSQAFKTASGTDVVKYAYLAGEVSPILDEDISRRTPISQTVVLETYKDETGKDMETLKTVFLSKPQLYKDGDAWRQIEYATTTPEVFALSGAIPYIKRRELAEKILPGESVFAVTSTFYPDPDTETTSVDGEVTAVGSSLTSLDDAMLNARDETFGIAQDSATTIDTYSNVFDDGLGSYSANIARSFFLFDTSALTAGAVISSATFSTYVYAVDNNDDDGNDYIGLYTATPASNTTLASGDYDAVGSTLQSDATTDISGITVGAFPITLNATGRGNISKTGVTKFALREGHDLLGGGLCDGCFSGIYVNAAESSGTSEDPKLEVTYTLPATFSVGSWFPF
jgi:hypothetical protein